MAERNESIEEDELRDPISDDIDVDMTTGGKTDPPLDFQEEFLGLALALPASETSRATLAVAIAKGGRREGETVSAHVRDCPHLATVIEALAPRLPNPCT